MYQVSQEINTKECFYLLNNYFTLQTKKNFKEILGKTNFEVLEKFI